MLIIKFYFIIDNLGAVAVMVILNMIFFFNSIICIVPQLYSHGVLQDFELNTLSQ